MGTRQHGFTIWELMMAVVVAGIILSLAVPSFQDFQRSNAMAAVANDFVTGALLARSEAVKRQAPVTLCTTDDPAAEPPICSAASEGAFVVFVDENGNGVLTDATDGNATVDTAELVVLRNGAPGGRIRVWMDANIITYGANGYPRPGSATQFLFCDDRGTGAAAGGQSAARLLRFDPTGRRGNIRSDVATVQAAEVLLDAECGA